MPQMSRQKRRAYQSKLRKTVMKVSLEIDPTIPYPVLLPKGYPLPSDKGWKVLLVEETLIKPRFWWKWIVKFRPLWKKKIKVLGTFE